MRRYWVLAAPLRHLSLARPCQAFSISGSYGISLEEMSGHGEVFGDFSKAVAHCKKCFFHLTGPSVWIGPTLLHALHASRIVDQALVLCTKLRRGSRRQQGLFAQRAPRNGLTIEKKTNTRLGFDSKSGDPKWLAFGVARSDGPGPAPNKAHLRSLQVVSTSSLHLHPVPVGQKDHQGGALDMLRHTIFPNNHENGQVEFEKESSSPTASCPLLFFDF